MAYTEKFQDLADAAMSRVAAVAPDQVDALMREGAIALDIRDKEELGIPRPRDQPFRTIVTADSVLS